MAAVINCIKISIMHQLIIIIYIYFRITLLYITGQEFILICLLLVTVFSSKVTSITAPPGFGYTLLLVRRNAILNTSVVFMHSLSEWSFGVHYILESTFRAVINVDQITEFTSNPCFEREVLAMTKFLTKETFYFVPFLILGQ